MEEESDTWQVLIVRKRIFPAISYNRAGLLSCPGKGLPVAESVELLYGLQEMKSIADGDMPVNELAESIGRLFGIEMKGAVFYNTYTNLKHRKNDSRTYYLDKMRERLNLRMQRDEERERFRR